VADPPAHPNPPALPDPALPRAGDLVVAAGVGVTGLPVVRHLAGIGARVVVTSNRSAPEALDDIAGDVRFAGDLAEPPEGTGLVITSAGLPPSHPLLQATADRGIPVIGEVELAWWIDQRDPAGPRPWLVVTGTNGKTTTTGMLEAILRQTGRRVTACGNIGWPVIEAVTAIPRQDVIAVELSSFQLHWAPSVRPAAGVVLNVAEDHLDWHGSMAAYASDKARALSGRIALAVVDDPGAGALLEAAPAQRTVAITAGEPAPGGLGVRAGELVDEAFGSGLGSGSGSGPELAVTMTAADVRPPGRHNVTNALAAAGLALAAGATAAHVRDGLLAFEPGGHRNVIIGKLGSGGDAVLFVDDSKATNPHAALASLLAYPRVVWVAGGQLKGAAVDDLVTRVADRLAGVVMLGVDAPMIESALSRHAPDVPRQVVAGKDDDVMLKVVRAAVAMAAPGDVVLLAPAAASLDMYSSYAARGNAFADAARALGAVPVGQPT
jgi:UDP-N-acetylmuramoylalanine--D-glutamate ligase